MVDLHGVGEAEDEIEFGGLALLELDLFALHIDQISSWYFLAIVGVDRVWGVESQGGLEFLYLVKVQFRDQSFIKKKWALTKKNLTCLESLDIPL